MHKVEGSRPIRGLARNPLSFLIRAIILKLAPHDHDPQRRRRQGRPRPKTAMRLPKGPLSANCLGSRGVWPWNWHTARARQPARANLRRERLTVVQLISEARQQQIGSLDDVERAVLETTRRISFLQASWPGFRHSGRSQCLNSVDKPANCRHFALSACPGTHPQIPLVAGMLERLERLWPTTEKRGVPGSSPGAAHRKKPWTRPTLLRTTPSSWGPATRSRRNAGGMNRRQSGRWLTFVDASTHARDRSVSRKSPSK
jgi:hypothetical protein